MTNFEAIISGVLSNRNPEIVQSGDRLSKKIIFVYFFFRIRFLPI